MVIQEEDLDENVQPWILVVGFLFTFILTMGLGANDVSNSFGTVVGSKVLTIKRACMLATVTELFGSLLLGSAVSRTVRSNIIKVSTFRHDMTEVMLLCLASLISTSVWLIAATLLKLPVSTTHSLIGSMVGGAMVNHMFDGIHWTELAKCVALWVVSPVISGILSIGFHTLIHFTVLKTHNPLAAGLRAQPFIYAFTLFAIIFSILVVGMPLVGLDHVVWWHSALIAAGIGLVTALFVHFFLSPRLRRKCENEKEVNLSNVPSPVFQPRSLTLVQAEAGESAGQAQSAVRVQSGDSAVHMQPRKSAVQWYTGESAMQLLAGKSAMQLPAGKSAIQLPTMKSAIQLPTVKSAIQVQEGKSATQLPAVKSAMKLQTGKSAVQLQEGKSTVQWHAGESAMQADVRENAGQTTDADSTTNGSLPQVGTERVEGEKIPETAAEVETRVWTRISIANPEVPETAVKKEDGTRISPRDSPAAGCRSPVQEPIPGDDPPAVGCIFKNLQILTSIFCSFVHGGSDVAIAVAPLTFIHSAYITGHLDQEAPSHVGILLYGGVGVTVGLWIWGRRIMQIIGTDLARIVPSSGFVIELGAALTVLVAIHFGRPVSATHCLIGSVVFVSKMSANHQINWILLRNMMLSWLVTLPMSGCISAVVMLCLEGLGQDDDD